MTVIDESSFWATADRHLTRYGGGGFVPEPIVAAAGSWVTTAAGRKVLDFTSGQMSAILGHSHPRIVASLTRAAGSLDHLYSNMISPPVLKLARRLAESLPAPLQKVQLLSTGSEANEAALRLAKLVTGGWEVVSFSRSYHGVTSGSLSATYAAGRRGYGPTMPGNFVLPTPNSYRPELVGPDGELDWRRQLDLGFAQIDAASTGALAACIVEPIISAGGLLVPPPGYLRALQDKCRERGMLLILDEAQTGLCRTGDWYAFQDEGVVPDILTLSKTLGAGLPLAAVITSAEIEQAAFERGYFFFTTHTNDPLVAAVGNTVLDVLESDGLAARSRVLGRRLAARLTALGTELPVIGDVRGRGLLQGLELVLDRETKAPAEALGDRVTQLCWEHGLHLNLARVPGLSGTFRIAPPLTISDDDLDLGLEILTQSLTEALAGS
jgi:2,2-dialkylglycine decarboxylase (pyruvate)